MTMEMIKIALEKKLADAWHMMTDEARKGNSRETQRMFGFVMGIRFALMEVNKAAGVYEYGFKGADAINDLLRANFGRMPQGKLKDFAFPEWR